MSIADPSIQDQAYQFFRQEAVELLQIIEEGLIKLQEEYDTPHIHQLMRAAHSIKGGAASVGLSGIQKIAHRLEDVFRALYQRKEPVDDELEEALLQAYDCLRLPLMEQLEQGQFDAEAAWEKADPIYTLLEAVLQAEMANANFELPSAEELGVDLVHEVFTGDVRQGLERLSEVLAHPEDHEVCGEIRTMAEVFEGLGDLLGFSGFSAIAQTAMQAISIAPHNAIAIGQATLENFQAASDEVLGGSRVDGGRPSPALLSFLDTETASDARTAGESLTAADDSLATDAFEGLDDVFGQADMFGSAFTDTEDANLGIDEEKGTDPFSFSLDESPVDELDPSKSDAETDSSLLELELSASSLDDVFGQSSFSAFDQEESPETSTEGEEETTLGSLSLDDVFGQSSFSAFDQEESPETSTQVEEETPAIAPEIKSEPTPTLTVDPPADLAPRSEAPAKTPKPVEKTVVNESVRVDFSRLDRLNNLVGELVTQENGALLHNKQLQAQIKRLKQRFTEFESFTHILQEWMDQTLQSEIKGKHSSIRPEKSSLTSQSLPAESNPSEISELSDFDALQMDSYSGLYTSLQAALEEISQMEEQLGDITLITQLAERIQRQKQQTLKQVRNDLLWARMIPLQDILNRFPRMVRDLSTQYHKRVRFQQIGASTLVDKLVLERLYDPLVHLIRNAFDHGCEFPEIRTAAGKPPQATIEVRAYHRGNQTYIEVKDNGRGIDPEKLRQSVIDKGLLDVDAAKALSSLELYQFLFEPSFSTAEEVSELSGRGMGLNAVMKQVQTLKGSIKIESEVGQGTTFIICLPLTLTIAKLLVFSIDGRAMAIPVDSLQGIIAADDSEITSIQGRSFYRDEDDLIPLYPPSAFMHQYPLPKGLSEDGSSVALSQGDKTPILIISSGADIIALEVDSVMAEQELVIKPFGRAVAPPAYLYGCAILGDGALVPVIDSQVLLSSWNNSQQSFEFRSSETTAPSLPSDMSTMNSFHRYILVVDDSLTTRQNVTLTLQKFGYQVIQAGDGREALEQLQKHPQIKAVVSDVEMPNMNGFEFLSACRKTYPKERLPVIMLTSRSGDKHRKIAQVLGASHYLTKPYLEQDLQGALDTCLEAVPC